ncbi:TonB-dependent receptor [Alphaproteobacteria bacterium]|nr:TonB-dependent receptor [Alphaproteobacteria bacterium]
MHNLYSIFIINIKSKSFISYLKFFILFKLFFFISYQYSYAEETFYLDEIVVSATRIAVPAKNIASPISVIDRQEADTQQYKTLTDAMINLPGLNGVAIGGSGHQTSFFIRGSNSNHSLVLLDGIEMSDPSASSGAFDFGNYFIGSLSRIEVLRGAQASTYGSDAIGGVINIITKNVDQNFSRIKLDGGSKGMFSQLSEVNLVNKNWSLLTLLHHQKSNGESLTSSRFAPTGSFNEEDGHENLTASVKFNISMYDDSSLDYVFHFIDTKSELDPTAEDPDANSTASQYLTKLSLTSQFFDNITSNASFSFMQIQREFFNYPDTLANTFQATQDTGERFKFETRSDINFNDQHNLSIGLEYEHESQDNTQFANFSGFIIQGTSKETSVTKTIFLQDIFSYQDFFTLISDIRYDKNMRFNGETTYRVSPVVYLNKFKIRLRGAYGTGHRSPALFELFGSSTSAFGDSFVGNRNLKPESSKSWELGFDKSFYKDLFIFGFTYFSTEISDLIVASGFPTVPIIALDAKIKGVESQLTFIPSENIKINSTHTFLSSENSENGTSLLRRPKHKYNLNINYNFNKKTNFITSFNYIGKTSDVGFNGGTVYRGGYSLTDIKLNIKMKNNINIFARSNNIFDNEYEVADGFKGTGRQLFLGIEKKW